MRHSQVQRLREAVGLADRLLHSRQHSKRQQACCREVRLLRLRRIYNFLLFHANIIQLSYTFGKFLYFFWTNILI